LVLSQKRCKKNLNRWSEAKIHKNHLERASEFFTAQGQSKFQVCFDKIQQHTDFIVLDTDPHYPQQLLPYPDHPPILFGKGSSQNLVNRKLQLWVVESQSTWQTSGL
jgi:DNA processing protein